MTQPKVSIVIPTLDAGDMLLRCVERLGADRDDLEVIVVDNASSDGSVERAAERFGTLRVVRNDINRGYAPACNIGAAHATAPFVLFLNNDALLAPDDLATLLAAAHTDDDTAIWQPVTYGTDGALESAGDRFTWWGILLHEGEPPASSDHSPEVFATVGAALLVRRSVFERLGGFEDSYFAYYEESDLCWRARLAGWAVRVVGGARVTHIGSETTGQLFEPHAVRYLSFRNRIRTNLANPAPGTLWRLLPLHALACLAFVALYLVTGRLRSAGAVLQALWWPVGNRDVWREQRERVQAIRARPDREIFSPALVARFGPRTIWRHLRRAYWFERASERGGLVSDSTRRN
jgi:N-acetylglucosaminyl-diphospho-decaprenol L-rhamnosyltransferase